MQCTCSGEKPKVAHSSEAKSSFCSMKQLGIFLLPPWMGCYFITGVYYQNFVAGWRETMWSKVSCLKGNNMMADTRLQTTNLWI